MKLRYLAAIFAALIFVVDSTAAPVEKMLPKKKLLKENIMLR